MGLCMAMYVYVWLCRAMYGCASLYRAMYSYVGLCRAMYGCVWLRIAMKGYVWLYVYSFLSQSEMSNFFVYIINSFISVIATKNLMLV